MLGLRLILIAILRGRRIGSLGRLRRIVIVIDCRAAWPSMEALERQSVRLFESLSVLGKE
nr:hypothetical protein Q903MT_gene886 [Picea sitchensis]